MSEFNLAIAAADVTARLLRRLPPSLWDTSADSDTVQRDLCRAVAEQAALWLENRAIARTMTLMLEAEGIDLDTLLADYGLKRYCQRPDPYARQIGMSILWTPKGTDYAVETLADLLLDAPHETLRTGRGHTHVFVPLTHPITTPYSYWGLIASDTGAWYGVTVDAEVPTISLAPPCGLNVAPGPHTLSWFTALDALSHLWYVTIRGDTLQVSQAQPGGYGSTEPFLVLDGHGTRWTLSVDASTEALVTTPDAGLTTFGYWMLTGGTPLEAPPDTGPGPTPGVVEYWPLTDTTPPPVVALPSFGYWRFRDALSGTVLALWIDGEVPTLTTTMPTGTDQTPGGGPLDWVSVLDETGATWFLQVQGDTLTTMQTTPSGSGTGGPLDLLDQGGILWHVQVQRSSEAMVTYSSSTMPLLALAPMTTSAALGLWIEGEVPMVGTPPTGAVDLTSGGTPFDFLQVQDETSTPWYLQAQGDTLVASSTLPSGSGSTGTLDLHDGLGTLWHLSTDSRAEAAVTTLVSLRLALDAPPAPARLTTTPVALWVEGEVPTLAVTPPALGSDQTPGGVPLDWVIALDETGTTWYLSVEADTLVASLTSPGGTGSLLPVDLLDAGDTLWRLTADSHTEAVVTTVLRPPQDDLLVLAPTHAYEAVRLLDSAGEDWWLSIQAGVAVFLPALPAGAQDVTPAGGPYAWLRLFGMDGLSHYLSPSTAGALVVASTPPTGPGLGTPQALGDVAGVVWQLGVTISGTVGTSSAPAVDYGGLATAICLNDAAGNRWFWRVREGRLEWSASLWPDTIDQSPWGELGWLQMTTTTSTPVYVYPTLAGGPTATSGPPLGSPWGWQDPITLIDTNGTAWHLVVAPPPVGVPEYWQLRNEVGAVQYFWMDAEVPTTQSTVPPAGSNVTPGGVPLDTFALRDDSGRQLWVTLQGDTLVVEAARGTGVSTDVAVDLVDALGQVWHLDARLGTEALRDTLSSGAWRVHVEAEPPATIPPPADPLALRDAVEAIAHVQAAGSLLTVLVQ